VLNRHQQPIRFHQLVEDVLENVLSVAWVGHPSANEVAQPRLIAGNRFRDALILLAHQPPVSQRQVHLLV